jgi:hypothetical protein
MTTGLSVSDIVNVQILMAPLAAQQRNFGSLLILGDSDVIDTFQRYRLYTSLAGVAADFGASAPEYKAASLFFGQSPQPQSVYLGRWAALATHGTLQGVVLTAAQQALSNFTSVLNGGVNFTIDGNAKNLTGLNFSAQTNLNGVASVIQAAFSGSATVIWDSNNQRFVVKSATTGNASAVTFASLGAGVDISGLLGLQATQGGYTVAGINSETAGSAVNTFLGLTNIWYGLQFASAAVLATSDYLAVATAIEAAIPSHIFGVTTQDTNAYNPLSTTDLAAQLQAGGYTRTFCQYSSSNPYASASIFGRAFTVNFTGSNTVITLKFKQEPIVTPETLTETQAAALATKNCNVYVNFNNNTAILQQGQVANGYYFDEMHGTDWLQNQIQTDIYNALYSSPTKIPQTDVGIASLATIVAQDCQMAVNNGFVAPGVWTGPPVGALVTGQMLSTGFYVFQPSVALQSVADRAARKAPTIQAAIKLAGAVHFSNIIVSVNR